MYISRLLIILGLVITGVASQVLPHLPNFTSIGSIALFGTYYLGSRRLLFTIVFAIMLVNDSIFGFHSTVPFVYFSLGLIILMGDRLKRNMSLPYLPIACSLAALLFFIITNFGVWINSALYPKTLTGLGLCYLAAIPFLVNALVGNMTYGMMFYLMEKIFYNKSLRNRLLIHG